MRALALLLAVVAGAPEPVVGGGSFNTAPVVEPGTYRDTLLPGERLFYGIELAAGQQLRIAAELDAGEVVPAAGFSVGLQTPLREVEVLDLVEEDVTGNGTVTPDLGDRIEFVSVPVLAASGAREESIGYRGPGTWYVSLYMSSLDQEPQRVEVPVTLELEVRGEPQPDTRLEPMPAPERESGPSTGALLGAGLGGLVVGLIGGGAAARRRLH